ncbi:uncharacterized protein CTRU02_200992 [Colletotrichum truncatum]|uniref:Uncharacterized protein n=1 Tax=Colletotrichum truncatum TaxID=5467 RepID=A0ACC3ZG61_COLTU
MLVLLMGTLRKVGYEFFYLSHVAGFTAAVILTALHRPDWAKKLNVVMLFITGMWLSDRIIRGLRMASNSVNNYATFYALPGGGVRILLRKSDAEVALPGSHCFLWVPKIRLFETHPFTIVSNGPSGLELVMKPYQGFTKAVSSFAAQHHRHTSWASFDGPYGSCPKAEKYDKLILIAGGSGAAFTFGLMNRLLNSFDSSEFPDVEFVWAMKRKEQILWFHEHLNKMANLDTTELASVGTEDQTGIEHGLLSSVDILTYRAINKTNEMPPETVGDITGHNLSINHTRLNIEVVIGEGVRTAKSGQRLLVAACGPESLVNGVRDSAETWQSKRDFMIDVHCEYF